MRLVNTNPTGDSFVLGFHAHLEPGEEFDVPDEKGAELLEQGGNFALAAGQKVDGLTVEELHTIAERRGSPLDVDPKAKKPDVVKAFLDLVSAPSAPESPAPVTTEQEA